MANSDKASDYTEFEMGRRITRSGVESKNETSIEKSSENGPGKKDILSTMTKSNRSGKNDESLSVNVKSKDVDKKTKTKGKVQENQQPNALPKTQEKQ